MRRHALLSLAAAAIAAVAVAPVARAQAFRGLWVAGPGDIWIAGASGTLVHGTGGSWVKAEGAELPDLNAVWGSGPRDVWIVGDEGTILHWNGTALSRPYGGTMANLTAVFGCAANDVYAVGESGNEREPATVLHWNGSNWSLVQLSTSFRAVGIAGTCPDLVIAGTAFLDPRPDQRRNVGVVARLQGGSWNLSGWDGRRITDEQLGGTAWVSVSAAAGSVLLLGGEQKNVLLRWSRGAWTRLTPPTGEFEAVILGGDGSPIVVSSTGFARQVGGQWRSVGQGNVSAMPATTAPPVDQAALDRVTARLQALAGKMQRGQALSQAEMAEFQQLSQQAQQTAFGGRSIEQIQADAQRQAAQAQAAQGAAVRNQTLAFGERPAVFGGPGTDFYVASSEGSVMHVSGETSRVVFDHLCLFTQVAAVTANCRADGGSGGPPAALNVPPPMPRMEGPAVAAPTRNSPLPSIRKPRIRIP